MTGDSSSEWAQLDAFERDTLVSIVRLDQSGESRYELSIRRTLETWYGEAVGYDRLDAALRTLVDAGLVESNRLDQRTTEYEPTAAARTAIEQYSRFLAGLVDETA